MIFGITGNYASGKDSVAEILQEKGFVHVSFSDLLRRELRRRKGKVNRENLIVLGNRMREEFGADILSRMALAKVRSAKDYVFTSIRNPEEVRALQERRDFVFVAVDAPPEVRLERMKRRRRKGDPKTVQELLQMERLENSADAARQQLQKVAGMARVVIINEGDKTLLREKVERMIKDFVIRHSTRNKK